VYKQNTCFQGLGWGILTGSTKKMEPSKQVPSD
jgi:hypothetical protein